MQKKARPAVKPQLQSRETTAAQAGVNVRTIDRLLEVGKLKGVRVGRRHMVTIRSAERLLAGE
jgi:hypothetical protein